MADLLGRDHRQVAMQDRDLGFMGNLYQEFAVSAVEPALSCVTGYHARRTRVDLNDTPVMHVDHVDPLNLTIYKSKFLEPDDSVDLTTLFPGPQLDIVRDRIAAAKRERQVLEEKMLPNNLSFFVDRLLRSASTEGSTPVTFLGDDSCAGGHITFVHTNLVKIGKHAANIVTLVRLVREHCPDFESDPAVCVVTAFCMVTSVDRTNTFREILGDIFREQGHRKDLITPRLAQWLTNQMIAIEPVFPPVGIVHRELTDPEAAERQRRPKRVCPVHTLPMEITGRQRVYFVSSKFHNVWELPQVPWKCSDCGTKKRRMCRNKLQAPPHSQTKTASHSARHLSVLVIANLRSVHFGICVECAALRAGWTKKECRDQLLTEEQNALLYPFLDLDAAPLEPPARLPLIFHLPSESTAAHFDADPRHLFQRVAPGHVASILNTVLQAQPMVILCSSPGIIKDVMTTICTLTAPYDLTEWMTVFVPDANQREARWLLEPQEGETLEDVAARARWPCPLMLGMHPDLIARPVDVIEGSSPVQIGMEAQAMRGITILNLDDGNYIQPSRKSTANRSVALPVDVAMHLHAAICRYAPLQAIAHPYFSRWPGNTMLAPPDIEEAFDYHDQAAPAAIANDFERLSFMMSERRWILPLVHGRIQFPPSDDLYSGVPAGFYGDSLCWPVRGALYTPADGVTHNSQLSSRSCEILRTIMVEDAEAMTVCTELERNADPDHNNIDCAPIRVFQPWEVRAICNSVTASPPRTIPVPLHWTSLVREVLSGLGWPIRLVHAYDVQPPVLAHAATTAAQDAAEEVPVAFRLDFLGFLGSIPLEHKRWVDAIVKNPFFTHALSHRKIHRQHDYWWLLYHQLVRDSRMRQSKMYEDLEGRTVSVHIALLLEPSYVQADPWKDTEVKGVKAGCSVKVSITDLLSLGRERDPVWDLAAGIYLHSAKGPMPWLTLDVASEIDIMSLGASTAPAPYASHPLKLKPAYPYLVRLRNLQTPNPESRIDVIIGFQTRDDRVAAMQFINILRTRSIQKHDEIFRMSNAGVSTDTELWRILMRFQQQANINLSLMMPHPDS